MTLGWKVFLPISLLIFILSNIIFSILLDLPSNFYELGVGTFRLFSTKGGDSIITDNNNTEEMGSTPATPNQESDITVVAEYPNCIIGGKLFTVTLLSNNHCLITAPTPPLSGLEPKEADRPSLSTFNVMVPVNSNGSTNFFIPFETEDMFAPPAQLDVGGVDIVHRLTVPVVEGITHRPKGTVVDGERYTNKLYRYILNYVGGQRDHVRVKTLEITRMGFMEMTLFIRCEKDRYEELIIGLKGLPSHVGLFVFNTNTQNCLPHQMQFSIFVLSFDHLL
jgi:hypothetical protein